MLAPLWLALTASLALHVGVLLSPGWALPFDDTPDAPPRIAARLTPPNSATAVSPKAAVAAPVRKKLPATKPAPLAPGPEPAALPAIGTPEVPAPTNETPAAPAQDAAPETTPPVSSTPSAGAVTPATEGSPRGAPTIAYRWPRSGRIVFRVTRGEQDFAIGQGEHRWEHDGQQYRLQATTETTGLVALFRSAKVVQESRGGFDAAGLRPHEFTVQREGKTAETIRFDAAAGKIVLGSGASVPFVPAAQDMLSLFYQLAQFLDGPDGASAPALALATVRGVAGYTVQIGVANRIETATGMRQAVHFKVVGGRQEDHTEVWLDAETRLPLRIRHRDRKGDIFDQIAISIETEPKP